MFNAYFLIFYAYFVIFSVYEMYTNAFIFCCINILILIIIWSFILIEWPRVYIPEHELIFVTISAAASVSKSKSTVDWIDIISPRQTIRIDPMIATLCKALMYTLNRVVGPHVMKSNQVYNEILRRKNTRSQLIRIQTYYFSGRFCTTPNRLIKCL